MQSQNVRDDPISEGTAYDILAHSPNAMIIDGV
jgi:hypothetical protein